MLQINTGKMFLNPVEYRNSLSGVIYTNLCIAHKEKIQTIAGSILPASMTGNIATLVYEIEEQIEKRGDEQGILVSHSVGPYIADFATIMSFFLKCTATVNHDLTQRLLSNHIGISTHCTAKSLIKRVFDETIYCTESDVDKFSIFISQLLGLERVKYLSVLRSIRTYVTAMHRVCDDLELAYTLFVASVESLAQDFDGHQSTWADYDQRKRARIDSELQSLDTYTADRIRNAILDTEHTALSRRFREFALNHVTQSFYRDEASEIERPIAYHDLKKALQNAYQARSQYIHKIKQLPPLLTFSMSQNEISVIDGSTWFTLQGISRLARHIITEFIFRQHTVDSEPYNYSMELAGIVQVPLDYQYWIHKPDKSPEAGFKKLEGFLHQLSNCYLRLPDARLTDLSAVLIDAAKSMGSLEKDARLPYLALIGLYRKIVSNSVFVPSPKESYLKELDAPSASSLICHLILRKEPHWDIPTHKSVIETYFSSRHNKNSFHAPRLFESAMYLDLAERYRSSGDKDSASLYIALAVNSFPEHQALRNFEMRFSEDQSGLIIWSEILLSENTQN